MNLFSPSIGISSIIYILFFQVGQRYAGRNCRRTCKDLTSGFRWITVKTAFRQNKTRRKKGNERENENDGNKKNSVFWRFEYLGMHSALGGLSISIGTIRRRNPLAPGHGQRIRK